MTVAPVVVPSLTAERVLEAASDFLSVAGYVGLREVVPVELRLTVQVERPAEHYGPVRKPKYRTVYTGHYKTRQSVRDGWHTVTALLHRHRYAWIPSEARAAVDDAVEVAHQALASSKTLGVERVVTAIEWTERASRIDVQFSDRRQGRR